ncbi:hypothetical protein Ais01nite_13320 [Asanoa ishikariensis]|uniref:DUF3592 domain-containing protein n=1 Tax=Asanoa ishikariensis TaxID=137265 RepID=A0A1H3SXY6_9ACTN|nr:DUF3592 domain-containing protein [Asanoa ishikariensis]GIF63297.1 hypothetical protein Ais01nite_13320 [Asanoa ishikariensis]SDZ42640.1 Protein of unknown function [Asanoa ishikariensis]
MIEKLTWLPYLVTAFVVGVPALVGIGLIVTTALRWNKLRTLAGSGQRVTAQVVDNQLESWSGGRTRFRPVVRFQPGAGPEVTTVLTDLVGFRSHVVGTKIEVLYDPQNPTKAAPVRAGGWTLMIPLAFGLMFLVFGFCAYQIADSVLGVFHDVGFLDPGGPGGFSGPDPGFNFDEF